MKQAGADLRWGLSVHREGRGKDIGEMRMVGRRADRENEDEDEGPDQLLRTGAEE